MSLIYRYWDSVTKEMVESSTELATNTVFDRKLELTAIISNQEVTPADAVARDLHELPKRIAKQQKTATTDDPWQMWRYYNNAQVACEVLAGTADAETLAAFEEMLAENKLSDSDYYGAMTTQAFAEWLIGLNREFKLMGLRLEAERIRQRRELNGSL